MSGTEDKSRRTEKATTKKLRDARRRGQVIRSKEVVSTASILAIFALVYLAWDSQLALLKEMILVPSGISADGFKGTLTEATKKVATHAMLIVAPLIILPIAIVILANVGQFGLVFSPEPIKPQFSRINPIEGLKKVFSQRTLIEFVKSVLKVVLISSATFIILRAMILPLIRIPTCEVECGLVILGIALKQIAAIWATILIIFSLLDYFVEKAQYLKDQRMTREEVKRERKDTQGDPFMKSRRKQLHRQVATVSSSGIANSTVLVIGPDMGVALFYEQGKTPLPEIVAVGRNLAADRLRTTAREHSVPIVEHPELTAELLKKGRAGQYIPTETIDETAAILKRIKGAIA